MTETQPLSKQLQEALLRLNEASATYDAALAEVTRLSECLAHDLRSIEALPNGKYRVYLQEGDVSVPFDDELDTLNEARQLRDAIEAEIATGNWVLTPEARERLLAQHSSA